mgnify:CR=1 FL=1
MDEKERLVAVEERAKSNTKRLDDHEKEIEELKKTYSIMEKMDFRMGNVEDNVKKINQKLDEHKDEKGKKWDKLIDYLFYFIIAAALGYLCMKLGIK